MAGAAMIRVYLIAVVAGLAAATTVYQTMKFKWQTQGAIVERARVETAERKLDAKIEKRQRAVARQPAASVLDKWSRE